MTVTQEAKNVNYVTCSPDRAHIWLLFNPPQQAGERPACFLKEILQHICVCEITSIQFSEKRDREGEEEGEGKKQRERD